MTAKLNKREEALVAKLFDATQRGILLNVMDTIWQGIAPDAEEAIRFSGEKMTNEQAAEMVLDCSRLEVLAEGNKDGALVELIKEFRTLDWKLQKKFLLTDLNYY